jgi:alkylation response protein AidB-like acyl-CoA dehydrogenase
MDTPWWDPVHQTMWRFSGRSDLTGIARTARAVAREVVAPAVAAGARSTQQWTAEKASVLRALDDAGLTSIVSNPSGGTAMPLAAALWELAWVDAGAAVCCMSGSLAHMAIRDIGTPEQRARYLGNPARRHGALCLTEPLPGAGADAASLDGRIAVAEWKPGEQPLLTVEKRGRFTSHMDFAEFVAAAVHSRDPRFHGSCLVILEPTDAGVFERGDPVRKLGHQLSSTTNPAFQLQVPASRIAGGYSIEGDAIVPNFNHREALNATFRRARAVMALVTSAKLLSALETFVGTPEQLLDIWAAGEAAASLGFSAARLSDDLDRAQAGRAALHRQAAAICPAAKLFSTEMASAMLPPAAAGPPADKLIDAQLEAAYLGPAAIQRRQISAFMIDGAFLAEFAAWTREMRQLAADAPWTATVAAGMELWSWTLEGLRGANDSRGAPIYRDARQSITFPMADALCWLLAARALTMDVLTLRNSTAYPFYSDLATVQAVHASGQVAQLCTGLLFGHNPQLTLPGGLRTTFAALRAKLNESFAGVMFVRQRAGEFIRQLDVAANR